MGMIVRGCDIKLSKDGEETKVGEEANELTLQFRKTKADQQSFGGSKTVVATGVPGLCPVEPMVKFRRFVPHRFGDQAEALQPLFRWAKGTTLKRLEIQALLQKAAVAQNLPPSRFMSHSLRIGGGTEERRRSTASRWRRPQACFTTRDGAQGHHYNVEEPFYMPAYGGSWQHAMI